MRELIQNIRDSDDFQVRVALLQELAQVVTPDNREAIIFINKIASYNLYPGLAPYGKKVIQHLNNEVSRCISRERDIHPRLDQELKNLQSTDFPGEIKGIRIF